MYDALVMTQSCLGSMSDVLPGGLVGGVEESSVREEGGKYGRMRWARGKGRGMKE